MAQEGVPGRTARLHHHHLEVDVNQGCVVRGEPRREGWAARGPRSLFLKRCENGFGFTLRHFIVYPPESYTVLAGDRRLGLRAGALDEPMDTIFVKQVRAHSPAAVAGLKTGDRIVSVNGQTIAGRSYAQVVQLIHQSPTYLHLLVVPKEDDILQLYFGETAHHPETNQRPRLRSPAEMVSDPKFNSPPSQLQPQQTQQHHSRLSVHQRQAPWDDVRFHSPQRGISGLMTTAPASGVSNIVGRRSSESFGMTQTEANPNCNYSSSESVPSSSPGSLYSYPGNTPGCRLSLDAGLIGRRESANSQDGSASSLDSTLRDPHSSDDSLIISRIRKSFEQKEEFLKRPAGPILSTGNGGAPGIKEFYARPQKLQTPVWPPTIAGSPHHSPARKQEDDFIVNDKGFICGGPVTNVPNQDMKSMRSRPGFVTTLGRIQENAHPIITQIPQHALVSTRAKQFEEGCVDPELPDRTSMYKSELARLSAKRSVPNVAVRKREFEARSERRGFVNRESRSLDSADNRDGLSPATAPLPVAFSGNRLVPVGSHKLHCEPPKDYHQPESTLVDGNTCTRPRSNSIESSWIPESWPQRHKAVRQDSYLAACHKPVAAAQHNKKSTEPTVTTDNMVKEDNNDSSKPASDMTPSSTSPVLSPLVIPEIRINESSPPPSQQQQQQPTQSLSERKLNRPTKLNIPNPIRPASEAFSEDSMGTAEKLYKEALEQAESSGGDDDGGSTPLGSPNLGNIIWRDKSSTTDTAAEDERTTRRVSYLKATWGDRMHVDSDPELSDSEPPSSHHSILQKWRPPQLTIFKFVPEHMYWLRRPSNFLLPKTKERARKRVLGDRNSLCVDDIGDKENQQIVQEGLLHCKLTLVDGKRAGDRSWKQVWAVLRGPILCLYKERRDSIPCTETPVGSEGSNSSGGCGNEQIDVRCALVAAADNYTKRKHVLRVNTISGSELLLQAQDAGQMARWIVALQEQANNNNTSSTAGSSLSPVPAHKGIRKLTSFRNRSPTGQSPVNKTRKPTQNEPLSSPKSKTWKGRVAKQLRRIQQGAGSPVSPTAPHPPHPEGATIGIPLEDCPPSTVSEYVPLLVELCTGIVEARGLEIIGIYRVPGNTAAVSSLTEAVNRGLDAAILDQDQRWSDVNVISSLLKSFFRRLPDSLLTTELYPLFIQADKIEDPLLRMATIRKLVHDLPDHHYETLKYLLFHLKRVVEHCAVNKMEARNLAIVFGPTLVRTADDNMVTMVTDMSHQCRIVETLILHADWCFGDETVERLQLNPSADSGTANIENDPPLANHNLLLGNIHKVEGMKMDSSTTNREVTAKDIVSSIICAANRKMQKAKARKTGGSTTGGGGNTSPSATAEDSVEHHGSEVKQRSETKGKAGVHRKERIPSTAEDESLGNIDSGSQQQQQRISGVLSSAVASGIKESVVFSGNIANKLPSDNDNVAGQEVPDMETAKPATDNGTIRTYTGLSATTQERIRRFEIETKAMLHRDSSRSRREEQQRWDTTEQHDKERIDREWQQAKRELEADDILDRIADNPSAIVKKIVEPGGKSSVKLSSSTATTKPLAIVSPSKELRGGAETVTRWGRSKELEARSVRRGDDGGGLGILRRGSSAENVNKPPSPTPQVLSDKLLAPNGNLKRLKTGKEQGDAGLGFSGVRCGSLDSLHDVTISERPPSHVSDEGSDLLVSLTSTFDAKLRSLLSGSGGSNDSSSNSTGGNEENQTTPPALFRDPSLHRAFDHKQTHDTTNKEAKEKQESVEEKEKTTDKETNNKENLSVVATQNSVSADNGDKKQTDSNRNSIVKLHRSESLNKTEEKNLDCSNKLRRSESLNKDSRTDANNTKLKRSDSLTKNEKTESNLNKRRQLEAGRWNNVVKLKRKTGSTIDRSIKRRHTVGGTKDFDKVNWLDNRQREAEEEEGKKERRTSSPDLSSSRLAGLLVEVVLRPHSLADPNLASRLCNVPLESHV